MTFQLPETANIRNIADIREKMLNYVSSADSIELDLETCAEIDLSTLQLIESARVYASSAGKPIRLSTAANDAVTRTLARAGFTDRMSPEDSSFWFHKEVIQ